MIASNPALGIDWFVKSLGRSQVLMQSAIVYGALHVTMRLILRGQTPAVRDMPDTPGCINQIKGYPDVEFPPSSKLY